MLTGLYVSVLIKLDKNSCFYIFIRLLEKLRNTAVKLLFRSEEENFDGLEQSLRNHFELLKACMKLRSM